MNWEVFLCLETYEGILLIHADVDIIHHEIHLKSFKISTLTSLLVMDLFNFFLPSHFG